MLCGRAWVGVVGVLIAAADHDVLALRIAHDELLVARQDRHGAEVHLVNRVEEPRETVLRRVHEVVVQSEK